MPDRKKEKVTKGLEHCSNKSFCNNGCPYSPILRDPNFGIDDCTTQLAHDALELLKEQESEIVRCKDCKYYRYYGPDSYISSECTLEMTDGPIPTWFCASGERRGEAEDS